MTRRRAATAGAGEVLTAAAAVSAVALTLHALVNVRLLRRPGPPPLPGRQGDAPRVSVLLPCRDEARRVGPTLAAALEHAPADAEVIVIDDGSTDATVEVVRAVGGRDPRLRLLTGRRLPPGWLGKPHACAQLAAAARGEVLVFLDADVQLAAGAIDAAVGLLDEAGLDLVSPYPRQLAEGFGQRLVQPLLQWSWLTFLPLRLGERGPLSMTAANGQLLVCRAAAYRAVGGHAAVRDRVLEDVELARAFKRVGFAATVADGTALASCRMYDGWRDLAAGYTKSLWAAFGSRPGAAAAMGVLGWLYVLPPAAAIWGLLRHRRRLALLGAAGYSAAVGGRVVAARATGARPWDGVGHPLSIAALALLTARSWRAHATGRLEWRGRPVTAGGVGVRLDGPGAANG